MDRHTPLEKQIRELQEILDISERKADILTNLLKEAGREYEQTLRKIQVSEANFRAIFENAPEAIYILDINTHQILDCNPYLLKWLGYTRDELLCMRLGEILAPGAERVRENIQTALREGLVYVQERQFQKKDGQIVDAEVTGTTLVYEGQQCFVALIRDITERKQIDELSRYKELFESVSDVVFINDRQGRFLEVNDVACECLGYARDEFLERTLRDLTCPDFFSILNEMSQKIINDQSYQFELYLMNRQGAAIPFELQGRLIAYRGHTAFLSVARDMSIRKQLQETLIKSERLTAVGEMASGVAHNFNNLLQMIMAGAEAAMAKLESGKIRDCREAIGNILTASQRGADVVRRIKDFTLFSPGAVNEGAIFDLETLVAESVELTQPLLRPPSSPRKYKLNFTKSGSCHIKGKSSEIYEVLINLIRNALEAMPEGGELTIGTYSSEDLVFLKIKDTGPGIPLEYFQRIFEPFFTTKGTQSSGLGLSSCYGIVKKHHGEIQVSSHPGQGAEFVISFPKYAPQEASEAAAESVRKTQVPIRLLLIDDEENILKAVGLYFADTEVDMVAAKSGKEGLAAIEADQFDVVLCDLSMNDMDGLDVGKWVGRHCRQHAKAKIPFLLYTGLDKQPDPAQLKAAGIDRVVRKPTPCQDLLRIIREMVAP